VYERPKSSGGRRSVAYSTWPVDLHLTQAGPFLVKVDQFWIPKLGWPDQNWSTKIAASALTI